MVEQYRLIECGSSWKAKCGWLLGIDIDDDGGEVRRYY